METDLFEAAKADDVEPFEQLPLHRLNEVSDARNSFVHIAAFHGSKRVMEKLLEYIRSSDLEGQNHELLRRQNRHGNTAFHEAARGGKAEVLQILITHSPQLARELASVRNRAGETAVFKAAFAGHTDIIDMFEYFLRPMPMEMYSRGSDGQTSLHCAIFNKRTDVVKKLLFHKHELISTIDGLGRTPLHVAALIPPFKELVPPFHPWLTTTHIKENENIAELLLREDKSLCHKMDDGRHNPLHIAVKEANDKVMKTILRYGGDCIEQVDNEGRNALHLAVKNAELIYERIPERMEDMLESLVSATKMLINDCDNYGKTTLDIAIDSMHKDELLFSGVKRLLEEHGAIRNANIVKELQLPGTKSKWKSEIISWNAVLIGTAAFAAPFALLQGNSNPLHAEWKNYETQSEYNLFLLLFYVFFLADTVALVTSVAATVLLLFAIIGEKEDKPMVEISFMAVMKALLAVLLAYGCAVALLLGPKYLWLTVTVWFMLLVTPLAIRVTTFRSKLYIFTQPHKFIWFIVEDTLGLIITLIYHVLDIVILLLYDGFKSARRSILRRNLW